MVILAVVACGAASRLRLKRLVRSEHPSRVVSRMWSGFSSEIETPCPRLWHVPLRGVACGAASRLRLKRVINQTVIHDQLGRMWSGFSSEIETHNCGGDNCLLCRRMWSGFSSEIETDQGNKRTYTSCRASHVERLLV